MQERVLAQVETATGCQNLCIEFGGEGEQFFGHGKIDGQGVAFEREGQDALTFTHAFEYIEKRRASASGNELEDLRKIPLSIVLRYDKLILNKAAFAVPLVPVVDSIEGEKELLIVNEFLGRVLDKSNGPVEYPDGEAIQRKGGKKKGHGQ